MPMMAITTSSSISVKPRRRGGDWIRPKRRNSGNTGLWYIFLFSSWNGSETRADVSSPGPAQMPQWIGRLTHKTLSRPDAHR